MRLGSLIRVLGLPGLVGPPVPAQAQVEGPRMVPKLPWEKALLPPWISQAEGQGEVPPAPPEAPEGRGLTLDLQPDGRLRVADRKGTLHLSMGLPGRPKRVWRDGGRPLEPTGHWPFPAQTPLSDKRISQLLTAEDPRATLSGLLWVLDDGERRLTVVHPATAKVLFLRLPEGESADLAFFPDHLEYRATTETGPRRWALSWAAMLPHLAKLGPSPKSPPQGTALQPFPQED